MRSWIALALLLPSLALAAPSTEEWARHEGARVDVAYVDGTKDTGTVVAIEGDQVRLRKDDGTLTLVPMSVVASVAPAAAAPRTITPVYDDGGPPPPAEPVTAPRRGPTVGVGVGVGMGPVAVGIGGSTGRTVAIAAPETGGYRAHVVAVRYPLRGDTEIDWMLFDDAGVAADRPPELLRSRALRSYVLLDEWGRMVPWQAVWSQAGSERDYVAEVKRMDRAMIPLRGAETALFVGGLGLTLYTLFDPTPTASAPYREPTFVAGSALLVSNVVFNLAVTTPTRNRMKAELGRKTLDRAQTR